MIRFQCRFHIYRAARTLSATNRLQIRQHRDVWNSDVFFSDDFDNGHGDANGGLYELPHYGNSEETSRAWYSSTSNTYIPTELTGNSGRQSSGSSKLAYLFDIEYPHLDVLTTGGLNLTIYFRLSPISSAANASSSTTVVTIHWATETCNFNKSYPKCDIPNSHNSNRRTVSIGQVRRKYRTRKLTN